MPLTESDLLAQRLAISDDWITIDYNCDDTPDLTYIAFWQVITETARFPVQVELSAYGFRGFSNSKEGAIRALIIHTNLLTPLHKSRSLIHIHDLTTIEA